jgi:hypothetical protein
MFFEERLPACASFAKGCLSGEHKPTLPIAPGRQRDQLGEFGLKIVVCHPYGPLPWSF